MAGKKKVLGKTQSHATKALSKSAKTNALATKVIFSKPTKNAIPSAATLDMTFDELGQRLGQVISDEFAVNHNKSWRTMPTFSLRPNKSNVYESFLKPPKPTKKYPNPAPRTINDAFRTAIPDQDEIVSSATVDSLVNGIRKTMPLGGPEEKYISDAVELFSDIRAPTQFVGFDFKPKMTSLMGLNASQHTTNKGQGGLHLVSGDASSSAFLDRLRAQAVALDMRRALDSNLGSEEILKGIARTAIAFTTNYFMAPPDAGNLQNRATAISDMTLKPRASEDRERLKAIFEALGGRPRGFMSQADDAPWGAGVQSHASLEDFEQDLVARQADLMEQSRGLVYRVRRTLGLQPVLSVVPPVSPRRGNPLTPSKSSSGTVFDSLSQVASQAASAVWQLVPSPQDISRRLFAT